MRRLTASGLILVLAVLGQVSCATTHEGQARKVEYGKGDGGASSEGMNEARLQDELLRFEGRFGQGVQDALRPLFDDPDPRVRRQAMASSLLYASAALDIALGPSPSTNLLDMVAFVELVRAVNLRYWLPKVYGKKGARLKALLDSAQGEIWKVAVAALKPGARDALRGLILRWLKENPDRTSVEAVRFSEFAYIAGDEAQRAAVSGLMGNVQGAIGAAEAAKLLGERYLHYAQRAPFLIRAHARLGLLDGMYDISAALGSSDLHGRLLQEFRGIVRAELDRMFLHAFLAGSGVVVIAFLAWLAARGVGLKLDRRRALKAESPAGTRGQGPGRRAA